MKDVSMFGGEKYYDPNYCLWLEEIVKHTCDELNIKHLINDPYEEYNNERVRANPTDKQADT